MTKTRGQNTNRLKNKPETEGEALKPVKPAVKANTTPPKTKNTPPAKKAVPVIEEAHPQNPTPEMEVHHHPELDHKPKPWKEYFIEGFMIFIAVMMGFIAENIREDITNHDHVQQLTSQLVRDIKEDTAQLNYMARKETTILAYNDSLVSMAQQPLAKVNTRALQYLAINSHSMWQFHPSEGAIPAIKNELHLKQFSDSHLISYFVKYEKHIELLHTAQEINLEYQKIYLDPFLTQHFTPANLDAGFKNLPLPDAQLRNLSQQDLTQLGTGMVLIRVITNEMIQDDDELKKDAADLLKYVKSEYNPKEE
jgi:hypothetical protein